MGEEAWGPWIEHDDCGMPANVTPDTIVQTRMKLDGDVLSPMLARELDWSFASDPVGSYRIRREPRAAGGEVG